MKQPVMARVFSCSPIFAMGVFIACKIGGEPANEILPASFFNRMRNDPRNNVPFHIM